MRWNSSRTIQIPKGWCHQGFAFIMSANLEDPGMATEQEQVSPHPSSQEECACHGTTALISHASKVMLKILHASFSIIWTKNFQMSKLGLEKKEELEIKLPTFAGWYRKQGNFRKTSISASWTTLKPVTVWITTNCGKLLERWEYQTILSVSWETCMQVKKQQLASCMEQLIGSRSRKEYDRAVCCHPVCLTYMLSTSRDIPGWTSFKLESR